MKRMRLMVSALLVVSVGCGASPTDPTQYMTPMREVAQERTWHYAALAGIDRPTVRFEVAPQSWMAAWVACPGEGVSWNAHWLATSATAAEVDIGARHEVCHLRLGHHRAPCPMDAATVAAREGEAVECERAL